MQGDICIAIRLIDISWPYATLQNAATSRLLRAESAKAKGNDLYRTKQPKLALRHYRQAEKALAGIFSCTHTFIRYDLLLLLLSPSTNPLTKEVAHTKRTHSPALRLR